MLCNDYLAIFPQVANPGSSDKMIAHKPNMFLKQKKKTSASPILRILTTEWYLEALSAIVKPYYMYTCIFPYHASKSWWFDNFMKPSLELGGSCVIIWERLSMPTTFRIKLQQVLQDGG